ncbi:hypothetical protein DM02DRAFT_670426 [Periconia macrospinosa]|uniref:EthD domain-containing protein n=1 Tax=Periconia macrospinosa TaxID=97972 RepID=A0A2V1DXB1_9PLEO|nr:hypothetical protein DM02DRAFT_670426 [Periconia macrospinosa]
MPITEFVFPFFKPELAKEAHAAAKTAFKHTFSKEPGVLHHGLGYITRHNGKDITHEYRSVLSIEWQDPSYFHAFYPSSPSYQETMASIVPFAAAKSTPVLFQNATENKRSLACFQRGATQVFTGAVGDRVTEVKGAWDDLIAALRKEGRDVVEWTGLGIEDAKGSWAGVLGWPDIESIDSLVNNDQTSKAVKKLRDIEGVQEYGIVFDQGEK